MTNEKKWEIYDLFVALQQYLNVQGQTQSRLDGFGVESLQRKYVPIMASSLFELFCFNQFLRIHSWGPRYLDWSASYAELGQTTYSANLPFEDPDEGPAKPWNWSKKKLSIMFHSTSSNPDEAADFMSPKPALPKRFFKDE